MTPHTALTANRPLPHASGRPSIVTRWRVPAVVGSMLLGLASPAVAQSQPDLETITRELASLREAQQNMAKDVEAIRTLLQQAMGPRPTPAAAGAAMPAAGAPPLKIAGRPSKGNPRAQLTMIEYSDYECPYCSQYVAQVYPQIERDYIKTNKVQYVFKNLPIEQLHQNAFKAHVAAACAGDQQRYWEMHDRLFQNQRNQTLDRFVELAVMLKLDPVAFRSCVESTKHDAVIREDVAEAQAGGVRGTPVFVFGFTDAKGQALTPVRVIVGAQSFEVFKQTIDAMLAEATTATAQPR
jgi:protein-disulfide isomerase